MQFGTFLFILIVGFVCLFIPLVSIYTEVCKTNCAFRAWKGMFMSEVSDFVAAMKELQARQSAALEGIKGDVTGLKHSIDRLLERPTIDPADVQALQELRANAEAAVAKMEALDAETPPKAPAVVEPPVVDGGTPVA